jgi:hypothetical protein
MAGTSHREDMVNENDSPDVEPADEPRSQTAGHENHEDVDTFRGYEMDAPEDTGKPEAL